MFISVLDLFKIGIGPSSSHTVGPMIAAQRFRTQTDAHLERNGVRGARLCVVLKGSLAHTGKGHGTDMAVLLGCHGYLPDRLADVDLPPLLATLQAQTVLSASPDIQFVQARDIVFDLQHSYPQHPNGMDFILKDAQDQVLLKSTYFSIGGGFIAELEDIDALEAPIRFSEEQPYPYPFESAHEMLAMAEKSGLSIAQMKLENEVCLQSNAWRALDDLHARLNAIWGAMKKCLEAGLHAQGTLPGGLGVERRAAVLFKRLQTTPPAVDKHDWLCAYAMAVNEENAAGHMVVTAPTNGAAGVIPAVLYYYMTHEQGSLADVDTFLLTAGAIGGLIKHKSSISGAEVGCQGEVGSAAAMASAGLCAVKGGSPTQVENAAEIALEHHLGMTCDPVKGLVQVPCIERNGFGAIKAYTAASLALHGSGRHFMSLDNCIEAMRQTGLEMSEKYKETALGGLAQSWTEC